MKQITFHRIKYKDDGLFCYTPCPHDKQVCVNSVSCSKCEHHIKHTKKNVDCSYPIKKGKLL